MKKDRLLKAAALGAALITCLSGFTSRPVTQNKLPDVLNPLAKTMAEVEFPKRKQSALESLVDIPTKLLCSIQTVQAVSAL